jgi:hypothetical protein
MMRTAVSAVVLLCLAVAFVRCEEEAHEEGLNAFLGHTFVCESQYYDSYPGYTYLTFYKNGGNRVQIFYSGAEWYTECDDIAVSYISKNVVSNAGSFHAFSTGEDTISFNWIDQDIFGYCRLYNEGRSTANTLYNNCNALAQSRRTALADTTTA